MVIRHNHEAIPCQKFDDPDVAVEHCRSIGHAKVTCASISGQDEGISKRDEWPAAKRLKWQCQVEV